MNCRGRPKLFCQDEALNKAQEVFWEKGYEGSSMNDLLEAMGISRQSLYNTYGNKHSLFIQCLRTYINNSHESIMAMFSGPEHAEDKLKNNISMLEDYFFGPDQKGCFSSFAIQEMAQKDEEVRRMLEEKYDNNSKIFQDFFSKAIESGEIESKLSPSELADLYDSILLGVTSLCKLPGRESQIKNVFQAFLKQVEFIR